MIKPYILKSTLSLHQNSIKNVAVSWKHTTDNTLEQGHPQNVRYYKADNAANIKKLYCLRIYFKIMEMSYTV